MTTANKFLSSDRKAEMLVAINCNKGEALLANRANRAKTIKHTLEGLVEAEISNPAVSWHRPC